MREIVYVAGETSGDRHGAALHRELIKTMPPEIGAFRGVGLGGKLMEEAGVELLADSSHWGAIGVVESLVGIPTYISAMLRLRRELAQRKPAALILIDFGYFNVRLARWAKRNGVGPVIYYMPPGSWKRSPSGIVGRRSKELAKLCDLIITPFQWSQQHLQAAGANAHWVGHPLRDIASPVLSESEFNTAYGIDSARAIVALLPGSRKPELEHNLPMMLHAASLISSRVPGAQFLLAAAPNLRASEIERMLSMVRREHESQLGGQSQFNIIESAGGKLLDMANHALSAASPGQALVTNEGFLLSGKQPGDDEPEMPAPWRQVRSTDSAHAPTLALVRNLTYDCLARSDIAITCSGTATLEAAILDRPMIIVYRGSALMGLEYLIRKRSLNIQYVGLPNIIADTQVAPELLQRDATPEAVSTIAIDMLLEPERLMRTKRLLAERVQPQIGEPGVIGRAAKLVWDCIESRDRAA